MFSYKRVSECIQHHRICRYIEFISSIIAHCGIFMNFYLFTRLAIEYKTHAFNINMVWSVAVWHTQDTL